MCVATVGRLARAGGIGNNGSGDIFLAFSTANHLRQPDKASEVRTLQPDAMTELFEGAAEAAEEAILNALVAAETMTGYKGRVVHALSHDLLRETMAQYGRGADKGKG
jgi:D-aminopeptidase